MTDIEKFRALATFLMERGEPLPTPGVSLIRKDAWVHYDVLAIRASSVSIIMYLVQDFGYCHLCDFEDKHVRNAAHIYDQVFRRFIYRDKNLF